MPRYTIPCHLAEMAKELSHIYDLSGKKTVHGSGYYPHADNGCLGSAVPKGHGSLVEQVDGFVHIFLVVSALICQPDIPASFFKELHNAQGIFRVVNCAAYQNWGCLICTVGFHRLRGSCCIQKSQGSVPKTLSVGRSHM